jgi:cell division ATPase FtsA
MDIAQSRADVSKKMELSRQRAEELKDKYANVLQVLLTDDDRFDARLA